MSPDQRPRIRQIFEACLAEHSAEAQTAILLHECAGDMELAQAIRQLLEAHAHNDSFLEQPLDPLLERQSDQLKTSTVDLPLGPELGLEIGPYKIRELIGEGGFGLVYVAEQQRPLRRKVALKVIKPGMDSRQILARFEAERQALALMDHPHVAKVLDAGTTDQGRPYFVMELVHGLHITQFCDQQKLTVRDRLRLFIDVCHAIQHAHQKGIIHRDVKPSNIMVTLRDGRPLAKVIDFGVAKAINQRLSDATVYTTFGQMIGTPMYMSPEQAQASEIDVDTRSDLYSLGVLLYELLTGLPPFDSETVKQASFDELRRIICETDPLRPSARVHTLKDDAASTIADRRQIDRRLLSKRLRGELDWIVMKTLDKDRNRRYETVNGLAADLQRYLDDEPVLACPPSAGYRLRKFARKHKGMLATAALVALALLAGIGASLWQAKEATAARNVAEEQRTLATERQKQSDVNYQRALAAVDRMLRKVGGEELYAVPGMLPIQRQLLEDATALYEDLIRDNPSDPEVRYHASRAYLTLGNINIDLNDSSRNIQYNRRSVELANESVALAPEKATYAGQPLYSLWYLGGAIPERDEREAIYRHAIEVGENSPHGNTESVARYLSSNYKSLGELLQSTDPAEAEQLFDRALHWAIASKDRSRIAATHAAIGKLLEKNGRLEEAEVEFRQSLAQYVAWEVDTKQPLWVRNKARFQSEAHERLGRVLARKGQTDEAEQELHSSLDLARQLRDEFPEVARYQQRVASAYGALLELLISTGGSAEADAMLSELAEQHKPSTADEYLKRGNLYQKLRADEKALADYEQAIALEPDNSAAQNKLLWFLYLEARSDLWDRTRAMSIAKKLVELSPDRAASWHALARIQHEFGMDDEALLAAQEVLSRAPNDAPTLRLTAEIERQRGNNEQALAIADRAVTADPGRYESWESRGTTHHAMGHYELAIHDYSRALELATWAAHIHKRRALSHFYLRHYAEALQDIAKAVQIKPKDGSNLYWIPPAQVAACPDQAFRDGMLALADQTIAQVDSGYTRMGRAGLLYAFGQYELAIADYDKAIELEPKGSFYYLRALAALDQGDSVSYRSCCQAVIGQFATTDDLTTAWYTAYICALGPDALEDYSPAVKLAREQLARQTANRRHPEALGAILMRAGEFKEAKQVLEMALEIPHTRAPMSDARYFLAMTEHHLGNSEAARDQLQLANKMAEEELVLPYLYNYNVRFLPDILRKQAEALISPAPEVE